MTKLGIGAEGKAAAAAAAAAAPVIEQAAPAKGAPVLAVAKKPA
jgi:hypothetical protein